MPVPAPTLESEPARGSWLSVLGWAAYLACSWTWCIGMFLPVLLVRDYGIWGFVVFAVPNVVGAGAMGWVLRQGASEELLRRHRTAVRWFSLVTIQFQFFFLISITSPYWSDATIGRTAIAILFGLVLAGAALNVRPLVGSVVLWLLSVALLLTVLMSGRPPLIHSAESSSPSGLTWLSPVCVFGFALCPYLDVTFLRTRATLGPEQSRIAFTLGFCVFFLVMILGTLAYADIARDGGVDGQTVVSIAAVAAMLHISLQLLFTATSHFREAGRLVGLSASVIPVVVLIAMFTTPFPAARWVWCGLDADELVYRCFMSFYGLVFPAYVWLCMIPTRDGHSGIDGPAGRRKMIVLAIACALAAPCYWMGFIERVEWWLAPGLGIVLLSRLLLGSAGSAPSPALAGEVSERSEDGGGAHVSGA